MAFLTKPKQRGKKKLWFAEIREGNQTVKSFSGFQSKRQLELSAWELLKDLKRGSTLNPKMTLPQLYRRWYEVKIKNSGRKKGTLSKYLQYEQKIIKYLDLPLIKITHLLYQEKLNEIGKEVNKEFLALMTNAIRKVLILARHEKLMIDDFTQGVEYFSDRTNKSEEMKYIHSMGDYFKVIKSLKKSFDYKKSVVPFYLYVAFLTGMRPGELLAITWNDINFDKQTIYSYRRMNSATLEFTAPKTENSIRYIPINRDCIEVLRFLKSEQEATNRELHIVNKKKLIFQHYGLKKAVPNSATSNKSLKKILTELNIEPNNMTVYGARHTRATYLISQGIPLDVIAKVLGHSVRELLETYRHLFREIENKGFDKISSL